MAPKTFLEFHKKDDRVDIEIIINVDEITRVEYNKINSIDVYIKGLKKPLNYTNRESSKIVYEKLKEYLSPKKII
jgi:hypothetical protein